MNLVIVYNHDAKMMSSMNDLYPIVRSPKSNWKPRMEQISLVKEAKNKCRNTAELHKPTKEDCETKGGKIFKFLAPVELIKRI